MIDIHDAEIQFALNAVRQAAQLVQQIQQESGSEALTKGDLSPVTVADYASQAVVARLLEAAFPADPLVGEEDAADLRAPSGHQVLAQVTNFAGRLIPAVTPEEVCDWIDRGAGEPRSRFWTLDPIDGTKGFLRGDQYAVALALLIDGQVRLGVLGCPNLGKGLRPQPDGPGTLVVAASGQGCWATSLKSPEDFRPLAVSERTDPSQARLMRSYESGHTNVGQIDHFAAHLGVTAEPVRMDSQGKYAVLAAGGGELLLRLLSPAKPDYKEKIWDQAAGSLILAEAGGRITDLDGAQLDFSRGRTLASNRGVLASNGHLHEMALDALRFVRA